jgi:hypothetical protein
MADLPEPVARLDWSREARFTRHLAFRSPFREDVGYQPRRGDMRRHSDFGAIESAPRSR